MVMFILVLAMVALHGSEASVGVNWGTISSHQLPHATVVEMIKANGISKVKLFDADPEILDAFRGSNTELMVAIPNEMLQLVATSPDAARNWVQKNITHYVSDKNKAGTVNIKYLAIGNEPFLQAYKTTYLNATFPALQNIQQALTAAGLDARVKATIPFNGDVVINGDSALPSGGIFRPDIASEVQKSVDALAKYKSPFMVNLYPFLSLQMNPNFPQDFAFFDGTASPLIDGNLTYTSVFSASYDLVVTALRKAGHPDMEVMVGEIGWPTDGDVHANLVNAQKFNQELVRFAGSSTGTPLKRGPIQIYIFSLIDEDAKSILPGNFERHWGMFTYDGKSKYTVDLRNSLEESKLVTMANASKVKYMPAQWCMLNPGVQDLSRLAANVDYACTYADCTPLTPGSSCAALAGEGKASFAFNEYYQLNDQTPNSCYFDGLAIVTHQRPSSPTCQYKLQIATTMKKNSSTKNSTSKHIHSSSSACFISKSFISLLLALCLLLAV